MLRCSPCYSVLAWSLSAQGGRRHYVVRRRAVATTRAPIAPCTTRAHIAPTTRAPTAAAVPEIKAYMQDIVPGVRVDPEERIALMRKNGVVRTNGCPVAMAIPGA